MNFINQTWSLLRKEILLEWRSKYTFYSVLLYVTSTVFVCYISFSLSPSFKGSEGYRVIWNVLFWIIMLFASVNAMARSFIQESRGRLLYYYTIAGPQAILLSKMLYNILLMTLLSVLAFIVYQLFFITDIGDPLFYFLAVLLGSISFSTVFTTVSAIAAKAGNNGTLMAVLSFPVIIPILLLLVRISKTALEGFQRSISYGNIEALCLINVVVIATSLILFPFLWRD